MYCKSGACIQDILPENAEYFKEELITETLVIPPQKPNMERILDMLVWAEVEDMNLIETEKGVSNEGQRLTGYKLVVELKLKEKLTYVALEPSQSAHAAHYEMFKSMFVILPEEINGKSACDLFRANRLSVIPYVECTHSRMIDCRTIHKCVMVFLDVKAC